MKMPARRTRSCATRTRQSVQSCVLAVVAGCLLLAGCGKTEYELAPVSGQVTMKGKPLADIKVSFQPVSQRPDQPNPGPGSYASTDADGRFTLRVMERDADGAVVGLHQVRVATKAPPQDPADDRAPVYKEIVPRQWRDGSKTFEVPPEGTDQANFDVSTR